MANNRWRRAERLRTPEERERYALSQMSDILGEAIQTVEEAQGLVDKWFTEIINKVKGVFR